MKKEIMELLNNPAPNGKIFKLNNICYLNRRTKALGIDVDRLELIFNPINSVEFVGAYEIKSRDYDGIINEVSEYTKEFLNKVSERLCKNLKAGYRNA